MKVLGSTPRAAWDEAARLSPHATFFHTYEWASVFAKTYPDKYRLATRTYRWPGRDVVFPAMQIYSEGLGTFLSYYSNWPGVYGGFLHGEGTPAGRIAEIVRSLANLRAARWTVFGNPFADLDAAFTGWRKTSNFTHVVDLEGVRNQDDLLQRYARPVRNKLNKARRAGISVEQARSVRDIDDYFDIYRQSLRRWGDTATNRYDLDLFKNFFALGSPRVAFWLVKKEGKIVGGSLNFYFNRHAVEWHGVCADEFFSWGVRNHLAHALISDALARGCRHYDFNPSGGHAGTAAFKESMGGRSLPFNSYVWENQGVYRVFKRLKSRIVH